jgi:glutaredoxin
VVLICVRAALIRFDFATHVTEVKLPFKSAYASRQPPLYLPLLPNATALRGEPPQRSGSSLIPTPLIMQLILYSKAGCHLCEGLQEKLDIIIKMPNFASLQLEIRDITTSNDWFETYQYEVPVLFIANTVESTEAKLIPRPSPRVTVRQLEQLLQKYL